MLILHHERKPLKGVPKNSLEVSNWHAMTQFDENRKEDPETQMLSLLPAEEVQRNFQKLCTLGFTSYVSFFKTQVDWMTSIMLHESWHSLRHHWFGMKLAIVPSLDRNDFAQGISHSSYLWIALYSGVICFPWHPMKPHVRWIWTNFIVEFVTTIRRRHMMK